MQREILGASRYKLYKKGEPITSFIDNGRVLTLKELEEKIGCAGGSFGGILDKSNEEQERFAKEYYAEIVNRKEKSDIKAISKNTGFDENKIAKVRSHIFEELHSLNGKVKKFDASPKIALAWQRLEQGNFTDDDIMLLNHEYTELAFMQKKKYNYDKAHLLANLRYPWEYKIIKEHWSDDKIFEDIKKRLKIFL